MEASQAPNMVDTNVVWNTGGNGIYQHDCDELIIAHNLVGRSADAAVRMQICRGRNVLGRLSTAKRNRILNNVFVDNVRPLAVSDPDNTSDYNLFGGGGGPFELAAWQESHGWDKHSVTMRIDARLDPKTLELTWRPAETAGPTCPPVPGITHDFFGRARAGDRSSPGPFAKSAEGERSVLPLNRGWLPRSAAE